MYEALVDFTSKLFVSRVDKIKLARRGYRIVFNRELANHMICSLAKHLSVNHLDRHPQKEISLDRIFQTDFYDEFVPKRYKRMEEGRHWEVATLKWNQDLAGACPSSAICFA